MKLREIIDTDEFKKRYCAVISDDISPYVIIEFGSNRNSHSIKEIGDDYVALTDKITNQGSEIIEYIPLNLVRVRIVK